MNQAYPRWIKSSLLVHFDARKQGLDIFTQTQERPTTDSFEIRSDVTYAEVTATQIEVFVDVTLIVVTIKSDSDIYKHDQNVGIGLAAMTNAILVKSFPETPDALLFCLQRINEIDILEYGEMNMGKRVVYSGLTTKYQATIEV